MFVIVSKLDVIFSDCRVIGWERASVPVPVEHHYNIIIL